MGLPPAAREKREKGWRPGTAHAKALLAARAPPLTPPRKGGAGRNPPLAGRGNSVGEHHHPPHRAADEGVLSAALRRATAASQLRKSRTLVARQRAEVIASASG